jgi:hypothetical protein
MGMSRREDDGCFLAQVVVDGLQLLKSPAVDRLEKTALFDAFFRGDVPACKIILL